MGVGANVPSVSKVVGERVAGNVGENVVAGTRVGCATGTDVGLDVVGLCVVGLLDGCDVVRMGVGASEETGPGNAEGEDVESGELLGL